MDDMCQPSTSTSQQSFRMSQSNSSRLNDEHSDKVALKSDYMNLLDEANAIDGNLNVRQSIIQINSVIDKADQLFPRVQDTAEMYLDAQILHSTTTSLEQTTQNLDVGEGNFKLFTFAEQFKIKAMGDGGRPTWEVLAAVGKPVVHNSTPYWSPLLGSFEFSAEVSATQQQKVRKQRQKDTVAEKKEPEKLSQVDKTQEGVEQMVQRIFSKLRKLYRNNKHTPISYFRFVINPHSFSDTVENIFHVSFLVNDGHVKIEFNGDEPLISPISKGKENSNPATEQQPRDKKQNIFSIDMQTWQGLVDGLKITEAMI